MGVEGEKRQEKVCKQVNERGAIAYTLSSESSWKSGVIAHLWNAPTSVSQANRKQFVLWECQRRGEEKKKQRIEKGLLHGSTTSEFGWFTGGLWESYKIRERVESTLKCPGWCRHWFYEGVERFIKSFSRVNVTHDEPLSWEFSGWGLFGLCMNRTCSWRWERSPFEMMVRAVAWMNDLTRWHSMESLKRDGERDEEREK